MADVRPFNAVTYDPVRVPDLGQVACPPYDVISDADRDVLYDRHPYNIVRIVSGREERGRHAGRRTSTRARAGSSGRGCGRACSTRTGSPALFVYRQAFDDPSGHLRRVWGLLGTISLDDEILAHEKTMSGPKADRLALMHAVPANLSPIYALYREDGGGVSADLSSWSREAPVGDFTDDEGTRHTVWAVHDEAFHEKVRVGARAVSAADRRRPPPLRDGEGATATCGARADGPGPWDHIMTPARRRGGPAGADPPLPPHRPPGDRRTIPSARSPRNFEVTELGPATPEAIRDVRAIAVGARRTHRRSPASTAERSTASTRPPSERGRDPGRRPRRARARTARHPLGRGRAVLLAGRRSRRGRGRAGRAVCGFLIPPVGVERVWEHAASGGKMPEKSTYFHPKPRDGIVIRPLEPC